VPKGGEIVFGVLGSFDSLNPLIVRGVAAAGLREYVFESLMARAMDEPFSLYGLLAKTIETPEDRSWVTFVLHRDARFSDGKPVTTDDVIFSHSLLRDHGRPNHRTYYAKVTKVEKVGARGVRFTFSDDGDREMPLIMGLMPVLPRHIFSEDSFEQTSLKPPVGSGPYLVEDVNPGTSITYQRDGNYWGKDLPVNRGRFNFDKVRYDYYRDGSSLFQAFKKGLYHVRSEGDPGRWALAYKIPAVNDGRIVREEFSIGVPSGMSALVFNTRKPIFTDQRVREALTLMFDFEWLNKNLYHGLYARTQSYFDRSELSSHGRAADEHERKLLAPFTAELKPEIVEGTYRQPVSNGSGRNRGNRRRALELLDSAGYELKGGKLVNKETGAAFEFEILAATKGEERLLLSYARALELIGIEARIRQVDSAQYQRRRQFYDFDMIQNFWYASLSPGNEQSFRWSAASADTEGTFNFPGIKSPAVDAMIQAVLAAKDRPEFVSSVRALDRALLSGNYVIPLFHLPKQWVARWRQLQHPDDTALYGFQVSTWWHGDGDEPQSKN
jgi:peptide/nickel transport system substrate-binding protein